MLRVIICMKMFELRRINADIFHVSLPPVYCPEFTCTIITFTSCFPVCTSLCYCPFLLLSEFAWTVLSNLYFIFCLIIINSTSPLRPCPSFTLSPFLLSSCSHPRCCLHCPGFTCVVFSSARCAALFNLLCSRASLAFCHVTETFFTTSSLFLCKRIAVTRTLSYWNQKLGHSTSAWVRQGGKIVTFPKKIPFVKCLLSVWLKGNTEIRFLELRFPSGAISGLHNQLVYSVLCWRRWQIHHAEITPNYLLSCKPFNVITQQMSTAGHTHTQRASGGLLAADFWGIPELWRESRSWDVRGASGCFAQGSESFWHLFYLTIRGNRNASSWILLTFRRSEIRQW